jgi:hypothetical protein
VHDPKLTFFGVKQQFGKEFAAIFCTERAACSGKSGFSRVTLRHTLSRHGIHRVEVLAIDLPTS